LAFADRWIGLTVYVAVALIWLVPDRRVERHLTTTLAERSEKARAGPPPEGNVNS
jgi:hypothetical protein